LVLTFGVRPIFIHSTFFLIVIMIEYRVSFNFDLSTEVQVSLGHFIGKYIPLLIVAMIGLIIFFRKVGEWRTNREAKKLEKEFFGDEEKDKSKK